MPRKPQSLQMVRAKAATREVVDHWFIECLKPALEKLNLLDKPHLIFNVDESGLPLSGRPNHVLVRRGMKSPQALIGRSGRENITIQSCISASGQLLPPYVVYTGKYLMASSTERGPIGTCYSVSENGWMTKPTYIDWFKSVSSSHTTSTSCAADNRWPLFPHLI